MSERRATPRLRRLKEARIVFNERKSVLSGIIRDASPAGARIAMGEPHQVPESFELAVGGEAIRPAVKVWAGLRQMGLKFDP